MRIDLHTHSRVSDGTETPTELVVAADLAGLDVVALTDHDTAAGWDEAFRAAADRGITVVPGMELSTRHRGHGVHLLGYLFDPTFEPLDAEIGHILSGRGDRLARIVEQLNRVGVEITLADVLAESSDAVSTGRPHVADALVRRGAVADRDEAFERFLGWGRPGHVQRYASDLVTMIGLIGGAGGVSVLAHPWGRTRPEYRMDEAGFATLADLGLHGIEVDHQDHDAAMRADLRAIATNLGLVITGSSDYHGSGKKGHDLGVNTTDPDQFADLLDRAALAATASGRRTPEVVIPR